MSGFFNYGRRHDFGGFYGGRCGGFDGGGGCGCGGGRWDGCRRWLGRCGCNWWD
ncbi:MAG: hypothetical protein ACYDEF_16625 [Methanosarcina sp.]